MGTAGGTFTNNGDGTVDYTPPLNFNGNDTLFYQVCDTASPANCVTDTLVVTVNPVNDGPSGGNEMFMTDEDVPLNDLDLLDNNSDPEGDDLTLGFPNGTTGTGGKVTVETISTGPQSCSIHHTLRLYQIQQRGHQMGFQCRSH